MPKIYEYFGLVFILYYNDHEPINVHVEYSGEVSVIEILRTPAGTVSDIRVRESGPNTLPPAKLKIAKEFINLKAEDILMKWNEARAGKRISPIKITRRIH